MLRHSFGMEEAAKTVEEAVDSVLSSGCRTADLAGSGEETLSTAEMVAEIISQL